MENILGVKNLSKKYDGFELKNINIELPKGMIMGFIEEISAFLPLILIVATLIMYYISYRISYKIYDRKEL